MLATLFRKIHSSAPLRVALSPQTIRIIKATAPVIAEHGYTITRTMYKRMFANHPEVKAMFNQGHQVEKDGQKALQPAALAISVHAYAANIDNLSVLVPVVEKIAQKHVSLQVTADQYEVVGKNLLWAVKEVLRDSATPEIMAAWAEGYGFLADIFINRERQIIEEAKAQHGGWQGWRQFVVADKIRENDIISSFYLKPVDGGPLMTFKPGQYIGFQARIPGKEVTTRNFSISSRPGLDHYRVSVKLEEGSPPGLVSTFLHQQVHKGDTLNLSVPCGDFFLIPDTKPVVFISGGVGLTPMVSMLEHLVATKSPQPIYYLDASRSPEVEAMHSEIIATANSAMNVNVKFIYDNPPSGCDVKGPILIDHVRAMVPTTDAHFYVCGPRPMMRSIVSGLQAWGVPTDLIHFEHFGPFE